MLTNHSSLRLRHKTHGMTNKLARHGGLKHTTDMHFGYPHEQNVTMTNSCHNLHCSIQIFASSSKQVSKLV
jgi:hypothetical protein